MYRIPRRSIYCETLGGWVREMVWVFFVIKIFPHCVDLASDGLKWSYLEKPEMFFDQYQNSIRRACQLPEVWMSE